MFELWDVTNILLFIGIFVSLMLTFSPIIWVHKNGRIELLLIAFLGLFGFVAAFISFSARSSEHPYIVTDNRLIAGYSELGICIEKLDTRSGIAVLFDGRKSIELELHEANGTWLFYRNYPNYERRLYLPVAVSNCPTKSKFI